MFDLASWNAQLFSLSVIIITPLAFCCLSFGTQDDVYWVFFADELYRVFGIVEAFPILSVPKNLPNASPFVQYNRLFRHLDLKMLPFPPSLSSFYIFFVL